MSPWLQLAFCRMSLSRLFYGGEDGAYVMARDSLGMDTCIEVAETARIL
jgi:hypothetical protein